MTRRTLLSPPRKETHAYVAGFRNYAGDPRTEKVEQPAEFFVSQLSPRGTLNWLTNLPSNIVKDNLDAYGYGVRLDLAVTDAAVYVLTDGDTGLSQLHRLEFDGTLSWSKVVAQEDRFASGIFAAPSGTLYGVLDANSDGYIKSSAK